MTLDEITNRLLSEGLFPIRVKGSAFESESHGLVFVGDLDGFIKAVKVLKAEFVFLVNAVLDEDDFKYTLDDDNASTDNEPIYLPSVMSTLSEFEKYIGQDCAHKISLVTANTTLDFYIEEPWWVEYLVVYFESVEKIEADRESTLSAQRAEEEAKEEELLDRLRQLINDSLFVRQPTQKAMLFYALDEIPELEAIERVTLQEEIQELKAKITAKGLDRKR